MSQSPVVAAPPPDPLLPEEYDQLDEWLEDVRAHSPHAPQWEFCEGFLAALVCCRSPIPPADYWPVLFDSDLPLQTLFGSAQRRDAFEQAWARRWREVASGLDAEVQSLDDERAYCPQVLDARSALAAMPADARARALGLADGEDADLALRDLPSFGQVWALGFMLVVETWPQEWQAPAREKEAARAMDEALATLSDLCDDDIGPAQVSAYVGEDGQDGPPSMSADRLVRFGDAVWATYELRAVGQSLGPRVEPVRRSPQPGRNDLCPCGSGLKFKKCHGAE